VATLLHGPQAILEGVDDALAAGHLSVCRPETGGS